MDGSTCMDSSGESDSSGLDESHFDPQVRGLSDKRVGSQVLASQSARHNQHLHNHSLSSGGLMESVDTTSPLEEEASLPACRERRCRSPGLPRAFTTAQGDVVVPAVTVDVPDQRHQATGTKWRHGEISRASWHPRSRPVKMQSIRQKSIIMAVSHITIGAFTATPSVDP